MTYYRVATQKDHSSTWMWKSMVLDSLDAVFGFFEMNHMLPSQHLRVFYSSSVEYLDEMLIRENHGLLSNSITATQLYSGSEHIDPLEMQRFESACGPDLGTGTAVTSLLAAHIWHMQGQHVPDEERTHALEMRRFVGECEAGADHDIPYEFTVPRSLPQVLAWARLLARVQRGELEP